MDDEQQLTTPGHDLDEQQKLQQYDMIVEHEPYVLWIFDYVYIVPMYKFYRFQHFSTTSRLYMNLSLKYS